MIAANAEQLLAPPRGFVSVSKKIIVLALLVASTGFDVLQIRMGENGIRFSYAVFFLLFIALFRHMRFPRLQTLMIALFCGGAFAGMMQLGVSARSILYIAWVIFSYGVIFPLFYYFAREHRGEFLDGVVLAGRAQIIIGALLVVLHLQIRARLLYYEASYFAYGLVPYCTIVIWGLLHKIRGHRLLDSGLLALAVVTTGSATLMLIIALIWLLTAMVIGLKFKQVVRMLLSAAAVVVGLIIYAQFAHDLIALTINGILGSGDIITALFARGGNRIPRLLGATYIFQLHPLAGVGIGQYRSFSDTVNLSQFNGSAAWNSAGDNQAINIYLELLVTTGIPTACVFFLFLLRTVTLRKIRALDDQQKVVFISLMATLIMLNFEANYLRPYLWMLLGAYTGIVRVPTTKHLSPPRPLLAPPRSADYSLGLNASLAATGAAE